MNRSFSHREKAVSHNLDNHTQTRQVIRRKTLEELGLSSPDGGRFREPSLNNQSTS